jgi:hypothetical protein
MRGCYKPLTLENHVQKAAVEVRTDHVAEHPSCFACCSNCDVGSNRGSFLTWGQTYFLSRSCLLP